MSVPEASRLREKLVDELRASGALRREDVARVFLAVPRERFVPGFELDEVYRDQAITTKQESGIAVSSSSQPAIMAMMLEQLDIRPGMSVLEIGAGTGYNAALLRELVGNAGHVTSLEIDPEVAGWARQRLDRAGYAGVQVIEADGASGWEPSGPYDRIELTVGTADIAPAWVDQLAPGGILVVPLWIRTVQLSVAFAKRGEHLESRSATPCGFMRIRGSLAGSDQYHVLQPRVLIAGGPPEPIDDLVRQCFATVPHRETIQADNWHGFALFLALQDVSTLMIASSDEVPTGFSGPAFGLADAEDRSLCLLSFPIDDHGPGTMLSYGGARANERLVTLLDRWRSAGSPDVRDVDIAVYARGAPMPDDRASIFIDTPNWRLRFRYAGPES